MRILALALPLLLVPAAAPAQAAKDAPLSGTYWLCKRATDASQFLIAFFPGGGVGGGEIDGEEVIPYIYAAASPQKDGWPGEWTQKGRDFDWRLPDQHMRVRGRASDDAIGEHTTLTGDEVGFERRSKVRCDRMRGLPKVGDGAVIPADGRFIDKDAFPGGEGALKIPSMLALPRDPPPRD